MIFCIDAGIVPYDQALAWQKSLAEKRREGEIGDQLLLLEHPPIYTAGRRDASDDLVRDEAWLRRRGMEIFKTDRGGRMTYHGPGQLVGYLIFRLKEGVPRLVWKIEEAVLKVLDRFHVQGERDPRYPGIWVEDRKIAALGLHVERGITTHGFALNVSCDLKPFAYIHPCGISDRGVTSLEQELGWRPSIRDVKQLVLESFSEVFEVGVSVDGIHPTPPE